jgi:hypothetical protein
MKKFIASKKNIGHVIGEINKIFKKKQEFGHHIICSHNYSRKGQKRPKHLDMITQKNNYLGLFARNSDILIADPSLDKAYLCYVYQGVDSSIEGITIIDTGDVVLIDTNKVHIISKYETGSIAKKKGRDKYEIIILGRNCHSIIPATGATIKSLGNNWPQVIME